MNILDCAPDNVNIYPGRKNSTYIKKGEDYNCNGLLFFFEINEIFDN